MCTADELVARVEGARVVESGLGRSSGDLTAPAREAFVPFFFAKFHYVLSAAVHKRIERRNGRAGEASGSRMAPSSDRQPHATRLRQADRDSHPASRDGMRIVMV